MEMDVKVEISSPFDTLKFYGPSVGVEPDEWMKYVKDVQATSKGKEKINLEMTNPGEWVITSDFDYPVAIQYSIDLSFALKSWPAGNEHAAYFTNNTLYAIGETLFMVHNSFSSAEIIYDIPSSWEVTTPYTPTDNKNIYTVSSVTELLDNCMVIGKHETYVRKDGDFRYLLAMIEPFADQKDLISNTVDKVLDQYFTLFGGAPNTVYLQAMFLSDEEDGEAFLQSSGFRTSLSPDKDNLILWGNQLAHEVFHKWLSSDGIIHPENYDYSQWFSEGFTEYYANLALLRSGAFSISDFTTKMEKNIGLYLYWGWSPAFKDMTLKMAGSEKWFHRLAVYNGGWTAAYCLDVHIRSETANQKSLDDVMLALYDQFGKPDIPYKFSDLPKTVEKATGVNVENFFSEYIDGSQFLPVEEYLKKGGFEAGIKGYAGEIYVWPSPDVTQEQLKIRKGLSFKKSIAH